MRSFGLFADVFDLNAISPKLNRFATLINLKWDYFGDFPSLWNGTFGWFFQTLCRGNSKEGSLLSQVQFGVAEWPQHAFGIANPAYLAKIM